MKIVFMEKLAGGQLRNIGDRPWDQSLIQSLQSANYVLINQKEYEMIEGRLNLDDDTFELLLITAGGHGGGSEE
ncbi:hypothetical protein [Paenibacillus aestuarii]|uniref:MoaD/ThiS family protein n=1 Tax=Paenibacillus aestuarii TaxID=516965 RepID=A0ABW0KGX6_9BACL|nr:hypothetical protein [Paenibacillus aestuarii]